MPAHPTPEVIDALGVDEKENELMLIISDHLDWEGPMREARAEGERPIILVYGKYP